MIYQLEPFIVEKIWGGERIAKLKNWPARRIGEALEVSRLKDASSKIATGFLSDILSSTELSYVVKFIDTSDNLSVQVHPNDEYAKQLENAGGKTECWYILDAAVGAGVYLGFKPGTTKEKFQKIITDNGNANEYLNFIPVKKGDFFFVPAGAIHAIGKDVFLLEVQQSSGITYRVWDWNRMESNGKPRDLHVDKALQVADFSEGFQQNLKNDKYNLELISHSDFKFSLLSISAQSKEIEFDCSNRYVTLVSLGEQLEIIYGDKKHSLPPYHSLLMAPVPNQSLQIKSLRDTKVALVY